MRALYMARWVIALLVVVALAAGALAVFAAEPGLTPTDGVLVTSDILENCISQTLAPGAQVWLKVPYHAGKDLELYARGADGVTFAIYDSAQITAWPNLGQPAGLLTPNRNKPDSTATWLGHPWLGNMSDFYYVRLTNTTQSPITFSFCTQERTQFYPPAAPPLPAAPMPTPTTRPLDCTLPLIPDGNGGCKQPPQPNPFDCWGGEVDWQWDSTRGWICPDPGN